MSYPNPPGGPEGQGRQHNGGMPPQGGPTGGYPPPPPQQAPGGYPAPPPSGGYGPPPGGPGSYPGGQAMPPAGPVPPGGPPVPYNGPGMPPPHQGQAWGAPYGQGPGAYGQGHPSQFECSSAKTVQIVGIFGWILALIMYLSKRDESPFVRYHAAKALNFQLMMIIFYFISGLLMIVFIGYLLWLGLLIFSITVQVKAAGAAERGELPQFPFNPNWVS